MAFLLRPLVTSPPNAEAFFYVSFKLFFFSVTACPSRPPSPIIVLDASIRCYSTSQCIAIYLTRSTRSLLINVKLSMPRRVGRRSGLIKFDETSFLRREASRKLKRTNFDFPAALLHELSEENRRRHDSECIFFCRTCAVLFVSKLFFFLCYTRHITLNKMKIKS